MKTLFAISVGRAACPALRCSSRVKFVAEDSSWLMLRGSGTEPILRIYAEAKSDAEVRKLLELGMKLTRTQGLNFTARISQFRFAFFGLLSAKNQPVIPR